MPQNVDDLLVGLPAVPIALDVTCECEFGKTRLAVDVVSSPVFEFFARKQSKVFDVNMDLPSVVYVVTEGPQMSTGNGSVLDSVLVGVAAILGQHFRLETRKPKVLDGDAIVQGRDEARDLIRELVSSPNRAKDVLLRLSGTDNLTSAPDGQSGAN